LSEERIYQDLPPLIGEWMPQLYATFHLDDWHVLLLEDLGPRCVPPWTQKTTRAITHALAAFHLSSLGSHVPAWLSAPEEVLARENWKHVAQESLAFQHIAALAGKEASQSLTWFEQVSPIIENVMQKSALREGTHALLHGDLRSDNMCFHQGKLRLFDWPSITLGRPEWDMVAFAQTVTVEEGPSPEQIMKWYGECFPLDADAVECALAWWLTFFAHRAWRPDIPGLPRLRRFQRQQLGTLISWAARHWSFPSPHWINQWSR
jgi:fructosamine-3-kinase